MGKTEHIFGILGIRKNQEFYVGSNRELVYRYTDSGFFCNEESVDRAKILSALIFLADSTEIHEVNSSLWRPKLREIYWSINEFGLPTLHVNHNSIEDIERINTGCVYRTEKEAKSKNFLKKLE